MSVKAIASRYAHALHTEAKSQNVVDTVEKDFARIRETLDAAPDLRMLFRSPIIEWWRKKNIAVEILEKEISPLMMGFVVLVIEKGRERFFRRMAEEFQLRLDTQRNVVRVDVESAIQLDESARESVLKTMETKTGKSVISSFSETPDLLGGVRVTLGDKVFDGSLKTQLEGLRTRLAEA